MKKWLIFILVLVFWMHSIAQEGKISRYEVKNLFTLDIYFPPGYDSLESYKVIYLNDGESIFGFKSVFDSLINHGHTSKFMVVGIHAGETRLDKYLPYKDPWVIQQWGEYHPFAAAYSRVVVEGIIPFVEARFNVDRSKKGRAIFGYSFGGLQATWMGLKFSEQFAVVAGFSPSYWVGEYQIIRAQKTERNDQILWFDIGTREWNYYIPMIETLDTLGWDLGSNLFYYEVPEGRHQFEDWRKRISYPLILFCGTNAEARDVTHLTLSYACIPSQVDQKTVFKRLNPIAELSNGVKYSAVGQVKYSVVKGKADINKDGSFISNDDFKVRYELGKFIGEIRVRCRTE